MRKLALSLCLLVAFATPSMAAITAQYNAVGTSIQTHVGDGLDVFLPIGGVVLGITLAWRIGKRFLKG